MPERNLLGFTAEEAAAVEARGQELYAAMRGRDIEDAARARAAQLYKTLTGKDAPSTLQPTEDRAAPVAG